MHASVLQTAVCGLLRVHTQSDTRQAWLVNRKTTLEWSSLVYLLPVELFPEGDFSFGGLGLVSLDLQLLCLGSDASSTAAEAAGAAERGS